jgi:hypothetical protein
MAGSLLVGVLLAGITVYLLTRPAQEKTASAPAAGSPQGATAPANRGQDSATTEVPKKEQPPAEPAPAQPAATPPPAAAPPEPESLPVTATAGRRFECQLPADPQNATFQLASGPPGLSVRPSGRVSWLVPAGASGVQEFSVRVTTAAGTVERRYKVSVETAPAVTALPPKEVAPKPAPGPALTLRPDEALPEKAMNGKPFTYQLPRNGSQTFELMHGPSGLTVSPERKITWTPAPGPARAERVTVRTNPPGVLLFRINVEEDPATALALPNPGGWVLLPDGATLIVSLPEQAKLAYIDTVAHKETQRVELPFKPAALAYQGKLLLAAVQGAALLYALDLDSGAVKKEIKIPEGAVSDLACHPQTGLVYATTTSKRIVAIDPQAGTAVATRARGMYLAMDPTGKALYSAIQPEIKDVLVIRELSRGRFALSGGVQGERALLAKLAIRGTELEVVGVNPNAAANGYLVRISANGKRVGVVGGGGYRPPPGGSQGPFEAYGVGLFSTDDVNALSGVVAVGAYPRDLAFHPVLDIGVAEQQALSNKVLHLFKNTSLAKIDTITLGSGAPGQAPLPRGNRGRLLAFGARGTRVLYYDDAGGGTLRSIPLPLTPQDRTALEKAYGK